MKQHTGQLGSGRSIQIMNILLKLFFFFFWVTMHPMMGNTTHIVGGDLSYRCLGNQQYEITLTLRRDCLNGNPGAQFDDPAFVGIFNRQGILMQQLGRMGVLDMEFRHDDTLNEILVKSCGIVGGDVCVHTTSYVDTLELPMQAGGYLLAYQRCCRNYTIRNILDPLESGATYTVEISEEALRTCNSSPVLANYPPVYICGGQPLLFNQQAFDAEGDSLVYKLCVPYLGANQLNPRPNIPSSPPYLEVGFSGNYHLDNMIGGVPPLAMHPKNGSMTGFAEAIVAQYLIAYCVEEYRDGKLLSVLRRDFQINVRLCNSVPVAAFNVKTNDCSGSLTIQCIDSSYDAFASLTEWSWVVELNNQTQRSTLRNPVFQVQDSGTLRITLIVTSSESCRDTLSQAYLLKAPVPRISFRSDTICRLDSIALGVAYEAGAQYIWSPSDGLRCDRCANTKASPSTTTRYILKTIKTGCELFDTIDVFVKECIIDPCAVFLESECLPNGMIQISALDGNAKLVQPKQRDRELFWNIQQHSKHPEYTIQNQNPILLYEGDVFSLTYKYYSWPLGRPKSIEFADICQQKFQDTVKHKCSGPCSELQFILSSCEDDYHKQFNLNYPAGICKTICGGACQFVIALFETNGQLINPSDYEINWSNGATGAYVELMAPYFNNLSVSVRKGDCFWKGKYIKSCQAHGQWRRDPDQLISLKYRRGSGAGLLENDCLLNTGNFRIATLDGRILTSNISTLDQIESGIYIMTEEIGAYKKNYLLMIE